MLKVGLTGGIGSGKSSVARRLAAHGALVIDADAIAREVVEPGTPALAEIVAEFGDQVLTPEGRLDRARLGEIVFADETKLARLNAIVHPRVGERTQELMAQAKASAHAMRPGTAGSPVWSTELSSDQDHASPALRPVRSTPRSS